MSLLNKEELMKKTAEDLRNGIIRDDYDIKQTLTFLLSVIIEKLDYDINKDKIARNAKCPNTIFT